MDAPWQTRAACRSCALALLVSSEAGDTTAPNLAVYYCPTCGERNQVEVPAGCDPLSVSARPAAG